ncbi:MAG: rRNA pseudouridine synthase [Lachnospiraceae bacterium]|nr:rRNA pseudouridine synthase [Lachnospiraceae bacterium]
MPLIRLDKFLASAEICSRSECRKILKAARVTVNGIPAGDPSQKIDPDVSKVLLDGEMVNYSRFRYYMLNKPAGYITANEDRLQATVMDLLPEKRRKNLSPVGRLDKDTEGLLIITDDGVTAHRLLSPKAHVPKTYLVCADGPLSEDDCVLFREGVDIGEEALTAPARLRILGADIKKIPEDVICYLPENVPACEIPFWALVTITEGKFHQVKRMFNAVGRDVLYLKRISMGTVVLDPDLSSGEWRFLTEEEISSITC